MYYKFFSPCTLAGEEINQGSEIGPTSSRNCLSLNGTSVSNIFEKHSGQLSFQISEKI
jgi:hypothetical protein